MRFDIHQVVAAIHNFWYSWPMEEQIGFGEYVRRLRRRKNWTLHKLAAETGFNYTHLSRVENDSTIPRADTVAKIAEVLDGDLKTMLQLADCLPRAIIDRMISSQEGRPTGPLRRAAGPVRGNEGGGSKDARTLDPTLFEDLSPEESQSLRSALAELAVLDPQLREAVINLIHNLAADGTE